MDSETEESPQKLKLMKFPLKNKLFFDKMNNNLKLEKKSLHLETVKKRTGGQKIKQQTSFTSSRFNQFVKVDKTRFIVRSTWGEQPVKDIPLFTGIFVTDFVCLCPTS